MKLTESEMKLLKTYFKLNSDCIADEGRKLSTGIKAMTEQQFYKTVTAFVNQLPLKDDTNDTN